MHRTRPLAVLALAIALVSPATADAAPPQLTASTTIVATTTGYVDVHLPRDVTLSPKVYGNPDVTVSGRGRMIGMSMLRSSADGGYGGLMAYRLPAFMGGRTQVGGTTIPETTCTYVHPLVTVPTSCTSPNPTAIRLPRGTYRIEVLTDGAPVTVRLNLRGLARTRATLRPTHALFSTQRDLPTLETAGDRLVTFGATMPAPNVPVSVTVAIGATYAAAPHVYGKSGCLRRDTAATPPFAYAPPCPGGDSAAMLFTAEANGEEFAGGWVYGGFAPDPAAPRMGIGGSVSDSGGVTLKGALAVVVEAPY